MRNSGLYSILYECVVVNRVNKGYSLEKSPIRSCAENCMEATARRLVATWQSAVPIMEKGYRKFYESSRGMSAKRLRNTALVNNFHLQLFREPYADTKRVMSRSRVIVSRPPFYSDAGALLGGWKNIKWHNSMSSLQISIASNDEADLDSRFDSRSIKNV